MRVVTTVTVLNSLTYFPVEFVITFIHEHVSEPLRFREEVQVIYSLITSMFSQTNQNPLNCIFYFSHVMGNRILHVISMNYIVNL